MNEARIHTTVEVRAKVGDQSFDASGHVQVDAPRVNQWPLDCIEIWFASWIVEVPIGIGALSYPQMKSGQFAPHGAPDIGHLATGQVHAADCFSVHAFPR